MLDVVLTSHMAQHFPLLSGNDVSLVIHVSISFEVAILNPSCCVRVKLLQYSSGTLLKETMCTCELKKMKGPTAMQRYLFMPFLYPVAPRPHNSCMPMIFMQSRISEAFQTCTTVKQNLKSGTSSEKKNFALLKHTVYLIT